MKIDFEKGDGLVPAIVQDSSTGTVLMLGYMNQESLDKTKESGLVTFYSRSKKRLWTKGESSGNSLECKDVKVDCDGDTLLIRAVPKGPVCHTGEETCFGEKNKANFLARLESIIQDRQGADPDGSYTAQLFEEGLPKIAQKVGEEAVETVIEALGNDASNFLEESADLVFHLLVLLRAKGVSLADVEAVLEERHLK